MRFALLCSGVPTRPHTGYGPVHDPTSIIACASSAPCTPATASRRLPLPDVASCSLPSVLSANCTCGCAIARWSTVWRTRAVSAAGERMNFSRAGIVEKSASTSIVAPTPEPAVDCRTISPPSSSTVAAASAPAVRVVIRTLAAAAMLASASPREPQRTDAREVLHRREFARCVTLERQPDLVRRYAAAVVGYPYRRQPAVPYLDANDACTGVQRVLDQLLHHRRWPLDDLPRRDPRRNPRGQHPYRHRYAPEPSGPLSLQEERVRVRVLRRRRVGRPVRCEPAFPQPSPSRPDPTSVIPAKAGISQPIPRHSRKSGNPGRSPLPTRGRGRG